MIRGIWMTVGLLATQSITACVDPCENDVSQSLISPNGKLAAVIFSRNCGATTGFNTQLSIVASSYSKLNDAGNTFIADEAKSLVAFWKSDEELVIQGYGTARTFKKEANSEGVSVTYAP